MVAGRCADEILILLGELLFNYGLMVRMMDFI